MGDLHGKVAVVTGAGSGIGEACARLMAERGAQVVALDIDSAAARRVANEIDGPYFALNVADLDATRAIAESVKDQLGRLDILVTSAGVLQRPGKPTELTPEDWRRVVDIDLWGTWASATAFGQLMCELEGGSIVTIASVTGMRSVPLHAYGPAKAAVLAMTANLATEWASRGVRVNAVSPGYTATAAIEGALERGERDRTALEEQAAMGRLVQPEEVARTVCFLASDEASGITGANIPVDCGWLIAPSWHTYGGVPRAGHSQ